MTPRLVLMVMGGSVLVSLLLVLALEWVDGLSGGE